MAATPLLGAPSAAATGLGSTFVSGIGKNIAVGLMAKKAQEGLSKQALGGVASAVDGTAASIEEISGETSMPTPAAPSVKAAGDAERGPRGRAATVLAGGGRGLEDIPYRGARRVLMGR